MSGSLQPHELQHASLSCPSLSPRVKINSCLLSLWNHLILYCPPVLPSVFPSIRVFSSESVLSVTWPKDWSCSFSTSSSSEYSVLIYFNIDWFDLAVQGALKSFVQHHSSKVSILRYSAFFILQLSHPYTTTGKTIL